MKIGILGDIHGNAPSAVRAVESFAENDITHIFQLGDFGIWHGYQGMRFLDILNAVLMMHQIELIAVRGNHDSNDWEKILASDIFPDHQPFGGKRVRSNITLLPRTGRFYFGGRHFAVAGGAASIDKKWRTQGESWWPEEELTDEEVANFPHSDVDTDIFLTHDCSNNIPMNLVSEHIPSKIHRQRIDDLLKKIKPAMHFHGHMHRFIHWENYPYDLSVDTWSMDMEDELGARGILDLDNMEFTVIP